MNCALKPYSIIFVENLRLLNLKMSAAEANASRLMNLEQSRKEESGKRLDYSPMIIVTIIHNYEIDRLKYLRPRPNSINARIIGDNQNKTKY